MVRRMTARPVCVVVGVGPGNGAAFARRFSTDGYAVALLARRLETSRELAAALPESRAYQCDVGDAASVSL
jgi:NAD(P)-dependent dehydrogenase (short-subunit alcohol dehydrogenase family)